MTRTTSLLAAAAVVTLGAMDAMALEEAAYTVAARDGAFEIRDYAPHVVAETLVEGTLEEAGTKAFNRLFRYISDGNRSREKGYRRNEILVPVATTAD